MLIYIGHTNIGVYIMHTRHFGPFTRETAKAVEKKANKKCKFGHTIRHMGIYIHIYPYGV